MPRITPEELVYQLQQQDPDARYLFVEGDRDVAFWSIAVPYGERTNAVIAPVRIVECAEAEGGERGRAIRLAEVFLKSAVSDRVKFFIDADNDALLERPLPLNVICTDFRDLEAYAANERAITSILYAFGRDASAADQITKDIYAIGRLLGVARAANDEQRLSLSFYDAFLARPSKVLRVKDGVSADRASLLNLLYSTTALSQEQRQNFETRIAALAEQLVERDSRFFLCGKDYAAVLAGILKVTQEESYRAIHQALIAELPHLRPLPRFAAAENFART